MAFFGFCALVRHGATCLRPMGPHVFRHRAFSCIFRLPAGYENMRYALIITISLGSTLLAQAEPIDRGRWIQQTGRASKSCLAKFRQKFHEATGHDYADCVTDQTNKAIDTCIGTSRTIIEGVGSVRPIGMLSVRGAAYRQYESLTLLIAGWSRFFTLTQWRTASVIGPISAFRYQTLQAPCCRPPKTGPGRSRHA